jgi:hypothetical protein
MAHHNPAKMKNTKATDKGISKYKMSIGALFRFKPV